LPEKRISRLSQKLVVGALAAFGASALLFALLQWGTRTALQAYCARPEVVTAHEQQTVQELQEYVAANHLRLDDLAEMNGWTPTRELVEITFVLEEQPLYHTCSEEHDGWSTMNAYPIQFADGTATVYITDLFEHRYTDYAIAADLLVFFACFVAIMVALIQRKVRVIKTLESELRILEGGDLDYAITVQGQDELGELAQGVEDMRRAMVSRETEKRQMEEATNRLMTSVSHDLRTPLTALLGYLEILEGDPRPASESPYLGKCRQRALQIRGMLNDLFEYFFVSTSDKTQADFPPCTVEQAFGKLLAEFADLLRQDDFAVNAPPLPSGTVRVNAGLLQRLFDNLLSNLRRYADRTQPVKITLLARDKELALIVSNTARPDAKPGTGLGLQNCAQMLRLHGGRFEHSLSDGVFTAAAYFPME
jgi:signal transduction histidine kinase